MQELAPGLLAWTARHPDWRPGSGWDAEVRCFLVAALGATLAIDPLVPDDLWASLDDRPPSAVLLTQAAHARTAADVAARYGAGVWGHEEARLKVGAAEFHSIGAGDELPGGARVLPFDQEPGGSGTPLYLPSHGAVAVGDVFIAVDGRLRAWWGHGAESEEWYRRRLVPSLRAWLELPIDRVLMAHGAQVPGGRDEIAAALERPPHRAG